MFVDGWSEKRFWLKNRLSIQAGVFSLVAVLSWLSASFLHAAVELDKFDDHRLQKRYESLIAELRCPKCQNESLAGSGSQVAVDLRGKVEELLLEGKTNREIKDFMVARYGDFVLYDPPKSGKTLLVWLVPLLAFLVGLSIVVMTIRNASVGMGVDDSDVIDTDRAEV